MEHNPNSWVAPYSTGYGSKKITVKRSTYASDRPSFGEYEKEIDPGEGQRWVDSNGNTVTKTVDVPYDDRGWQRIQAVVVTRRERTSQKQQTRRAIQASSTSITSYVDAVEEIINKRLKAIAPYTMGSYTNRNAKDWVHIKVSTPFNNFGVDVSAASQGGIIIPFVGEIRFNSGPRGGKIYAPGTSRKKQVYKVFPSFSGKYNDSEVSHGKSQLEWVAGGTDSDGTYGPNWELIQQEIAMMPGNPYSGGSLELEQDDFRPINQLGWQEHRQRSMSRYRKARKQYEEWDAEKQERKQIVEKLRDKFDTLDFVIGGAVSMDIFNKGNDKSQIINRYFNEALEHNNIHFVGDRIPAPGNDHTLAELLRAHPNGAAYEVETWEDTAKLLKSSPFV